MILENFGTSHIAYLSGFTVKATVVYIKAFRLEAFRLKRYYFIIFIRFVLYDSHIIC